MGLKESSGVDRHSHWSDVKKTLEGDSRYKAVESSSQKEDWFLDHIHDLKEDHRKEKENDPDRPKKKIKKIVKKIRNDQSLVLDPVKKVKRRKRKTRSVCQDHEVLVLNLNPQIERLKKKKKKEKEKKKNEKKRKKKENERKR